MTEDMPPSTGIKPGDVVFDCPQCGKSLAIDPQGAGLVITCPDCSSPVQVPNGEPIQNTLESLRSRMEQLELWLSQDRARFEKVSKEIELIQSALDRLVSILQDVVAPPLIDVENDVE